MLEDNTKRTRIIRAALDLAKASSWRSLTLTDIAAEAGVSMADIRSKFSDKASILKAFSQEADRVVLRQADPDSSEPAIDRLFDVLMTRFEVMAPFKQSLRAIARDMRRDPLSAAPHAGAFMTSQYWMLNAANINAEPGLGGLRVLGLAGVYSRVMRIWFVDDDPGHARTMAALDRELRRGAGVMRQVEAACGGLLRLAGGLRQAMAAGARSDARAQSPANQTAADWSAESTPEPSKSDPAPRPAAGSDPAPIRPAAEPNGSGKH